MPPPKRKRPLVIKKFPTPAAPAPGASAPPVTPVPESSVPVPQPVLSTQEKRAWKVVSRSDLLGGTMFMIGVGFSVGWLMSDKAHGLEKFMIVVGVILMVFGALLLSPSTTSSALKNITRNAARVLPGARGAVDPTDEHPAQGGE